MPAVENHAQAGIPMTDVSSGALRLLHWIQTVLEGNSVVSWNETEDQQTTVLALRNRLAPMLDPQLSEQGGVPREQQRWVSEQTKKIFLSHERGMRELGNWLPHLPSEGWCMLRGPALGYSVYTDPVHRPYVDLDLLTQRDQVGALLTGLEAGGFERVPGSYPDGYYLRHHFHVQRQRVINGNLCLVEVHWGLDHRWNFQQIAPGLVLERTRSISLGGISVPVPADAVWWTLLAEHLMKHLPALPAWVARGEAWRLVTEGEFLHLLDLILLLPRVNPAGLLEEEKERGSVACLTALQAIRQLWPSAELDSLPALVVRHPPRGDVSAPGRENVRKQAVFRSERLWEVLRGIWPERGILERRYRDAGFGVRLRHGLVYAGHALAAGLETLWWMILRPRVKNVSP